MKKQTLLNLIFPILSFAMILLFWTICAKVYNKPLILPSVGQTLSQFFALFGQKQFYLDTLLTFLRSLLAFAISLVLAVIFATLSTLCNPVKLILSPIVNILASTPVMAVLLLLLVFIKSAFLPIVVAFLMVFPVTYTNVQTAFENANKKFAPLCKVYGISLWIKLFGVWFPTAGETIYQQCKTSLSMCVKVVISGEVLAHTSNSLGSAMQSASLSVEVDKLLAFCFVALALSYLAQLLVVAVYKLSKGVKKCR